MSPSDYQGHRQLGRPRKSANFVPLLHVALSFLPLSSFDNDMIALPRLCMCLLCLYLSAVCLWPTGPSDGNATSWTFPLFVSFWVRGGPPGFQLAYGRSPTSLSIDQCVVRGVWCVVCGVWCVVCGVWCVVCGVWCVVVVVVWLLLLSAVERCGNRRVQRVVCVTCCTKST